MAYDPEDGIKTIRPNHRCPRSVVDAFDDLPGLGEVLLAAQGPYVTALVPRAHRGQSG